MSLDEMLADAARAIAEMPEPEFAVGLEELRAEHARRRRDDLARARHAAFLDTLELERAAYTLGRRHDGDGELEEAARWYRVAAGNDHADAALRLGHVLELLAERRASEAGSGSYSAQREEFHLITSAAQAYAEAYAAGHPEAADRIDEMLAAFTHRQDLPSRTGGAGAGGGAGGPARPCSYVRDFAPASGVLREGEIRELSRHASRCLPCLEEFIRLVKSAASAVPTGAIGDPFGDASGAVP